MDRFSCSRRRDSARTTLNLLRAAVNSAFSVGWLRVSTVALICSSRACLSTSLSSCSCRRCFSRASSGLLTFLISFGFSSLGFSSTGPASYRRDRRGLESRGTQKQQNTIGSACSAPGAGAETASALCAWLPPQPRPESRTRAAEGRVCVASPPVARTVGTGSAFAASSAAISFLALSAEPRRP